MHEMNVAIQGERASFHHIAAQRFYGKTVPIVECASFRQLCGCVLEGKATSAIMAIENSVAGSILPNYSLLENHPLFIHGEVYIQIHQNLLALPHQSLEDIHTIRSHPMALHQCSLFLERHPGIKVIETADTAGSAREIRENQLPGVATIASEEAAELYQLQILKRHIEDEPRNYTRFLIVSTQQPVFEKDFNKASVSFRVAHRPGSLVEVLDIFRQMNINLSLIQSVPIPGRTSEYAFHLDLIWDDPSVFQEAIRMTGRKAKDFKLLGVYQSGALPYEN